MRNLLKHHSVSIFVFRLIPLQKLRKPLQLFGTASALFERLHADPVLLLPELRDLPSKRQLCQALTLQGGEPHQRRALHADLLPRRQFGHPRRDEVGWDVAVQLASHVESRPGFICCCWLASLHTLHIAGNFYRALMWQGQYLHPRKAPWTGLPYSIGNLPPNGNLPGVNGDVAVHDVWTGAYTCS